MRLIDADELRKRYDVVDPAGTFSYCDWIMATIDKQPTIDAIPVEWLRNVHKNSMLTRDDIEFRDWLIEKWQKEQEDGK